MKCDKPPKLSNCHPFCKGDNVNEENTADNNQRQEDPKILENNTDTRGTNVKQKKEDSDEAIEIHSKEDSTSDEDADNKDGKQEYKNVVEAKYELGTISEADNSTDKEDKCIGTSQLIFLKERSYSIMLKEKILN